MAGGLARILSVFHYGIGVLAILLLGTVLSEHIAKGLPWFSTVISIGVIVAYYAFNEVPQLKRFIGDIFILHPVMTGLSVLWTDIAVSIAAVLFMVLHSPVASSPDFLFPNASMAGVGFWWAFPMAALWGAGCLARWILAGFTGRG